MEISRRAFVAGIACAALPAATQETLAGWFDRALALDTPEAQHALLEGVDASRLSADEQSDLRIVLGGLDRLIALRRLFPTDGASPYAINPRNPDQADVELLLSEAARGVTPPIFLLDRLFPHGPLQGIRRQARPGDGVWRLPGGEEWYALRLQDSPSEVRRRCSDAIRMFSSRAETLLRGQGLSRGSIGARFAALKRRPDLVHGSAAEAVRDMNFALERLRPRLGEQFAPGTDVSGRVEAMQGPDRRGYRDAERLVYYPDLHDLAARPSWTLATVAYHEAVPGHLLQLAIQKQAAPHPLRLKFAQGYFEGWAIYAESLADEMGLLGPLETLGFLQSMLYRLVRVTADIDIHLHRASRAEAVGSYAELVGFELIFRFAADVERGCIEPGGFAADALAALEIRRLKRGDPRRFHHAILRRGAVPAAELARMVEGI